jgi:M6 family metalloprotease-like protein
VDLCGRVLGVVTAAGIVSLAVAARATAQDGRADVIRRGLVHGRARPPASFYLTLAHHPHAFEFRHGWLERARLVRQNRQTLRARGAWQLLSLPAALAGPMASATAVGGTLRYPTLMPLFSNTTAGDSALMDAAVVAAHFWGTAPAPPYSIATYYQEVSAGRLTVAGTVVPAIRVSQSDTYYSQGPNCQGLCGATGVPQLIAELVAHADSTVDFSQFADSATGYVPAIVILDPQVGAECYQIYGPAVNSIWAHRFSLSGWQPFGAGTGPITTHDSINGHPVRIDDYIIQGGQGGANGCTPGQLAPIGTVTHETGHLFGLPDLYDTGDPSVATEGLGRWDLMSSGNEQKPFRPAHLSAWSLSFLGWISEIPLTTAQTVTAAPIETSYSAYLVPLKGTSGNEYFVLENRQPIGSDSMMYGPGLMIYHLDTLLMQQRLDANAVNARFPHALAVEEAQGDTGLDCVFPAACNDRGDAGDPFPGTSGNPAFGPGTRPAALSNAGASAGVTIDSIRQLTPFGAMRFRVSFGATTVVSASDTNAVVAVDGSATHVYRNMEAGGATHTIAIDSAQVSGSGRIQYLFTRWSDGGVRSHSIVAPATDTLLTAEVARRYLLSLSVLGLGAVNATRPIDPLNGTFLAEGDNITLTPVPAVGSSFVGWSADTVTGSEVLALRAVKPYHLVVTFAGAADVVSQLLAGHSALNGGQLQVLDGLGNNNGSFDVGDFVAWLDRNPGVQSSQAVNRTRRRVQR